MKITLDTNKSMGYGYLVYCCDKYQSFHINELEIGERWECVDCKKPLILRTQLGFYQIGKEINI